MVHISLVVATAAIGVVVGSSAAETTAETRSGVIVLDGFMLLGNSVLR